MNLKDMKYRDFFKSLQNQKFTQTKFEKAFLNSLQNETDPKLQLSNFCSLKAGTIKEKPRPNSFKNKKHFPISRKDKVLQKSNLINSVKRIDYSIKSKERFCAQLEPEARKSFKINALRECHLLAQNKLKDIMSRLN
eukprot:snap_masked-scaffold_5-processed-gene-1.45-mRNA-1 protein AED:0.84 eAED:1.00 QI:0/-1/0/1/-1/1/1/0/136